MLFRKKDKLNNNTRFSLSKIYDKSRFGSDFKALWWGFILALTIWFVAAGAGLLWITVQGTESYGLAVYLYLSGLLGVFLGGMMAGRKSETKGWRQGLGVGIILGLCGTLMNLELIPQLYSLRSLVHHLLVWGLWGFTGGYIGAYLKPKGIKYKKSY